MSATPFPPPLSAKRGDCSCKCLRGTKLARCARRLRAFVKAEGLDVKTSGPGRNKAAILADVQKLWSAAPAAEAAPSAPKAESNAGDEEVPASKVSEDAATAKPPEEVAAATVADEAAPAAAQRAPPPSGFEWGETY